jgi:hypothetical protein
MKTTKAVTAVLSESTASGFKPSLELCHCGFVSVPVERESIDEVAW